MLVVHKEMTIRFLVVTIMNGKDKNSVTSYEMLHLLKEVEQPAKNNVSQKCVKQHQI